MTFKAADSTNYPGKDSELVAHFDSLHDMGDPVGAARHVKNTPAPDGTWMIVEPSAGDKVGENLNLNSLDRPVRRPGRMRPP